MMTITETKKDLLTLLGRIGLSAIFVIFGFSKITGFAGMVAYAASFNVPFPELAIVVAIVVELIGGLMILFGFKTRFAALVIALFLIPVTIIFHSNFADPVNMGMFMKNLSIFGGMLVLAAHGAGRYSLDAKTEKLN